MRLSNIYDDEKTFISIKLIVVVVVVFVIVVVVVVVVVFELPPETTFIPDKKAFLHLPSFFPIFF